MSVAAAPAQSWLMVRGLCCRRRDLCTASAKSFAADPGDDTRNSPESHKLIRGERTGGLGNSSGLC